MTHRGPAISSQEFELLKEVLQRECGMRFHADRAFLLSNRLRGRLAITGCATFLDYYRMIRYEDPAELREAIDAVVNNETYFFRESGQLEATLELARAARRPFRVLSAGCASGEEPYSLAMLFDEAGITPGGMPPQVVGADVSVRMLNHAREARYTANSFRGVEGGYMDWYFEVEGNTLRLAERLRSRVEFRRLNLMDEDALRGWGEFDVILCRNVIIYYDTADKQRVVRMLGDSLKPGGVLFLGHSESLHNISSDLCVERVHGAIGYRACDAAEPGRAETA